MNGLQTKAYPTLPGFGGINTGTAPFNIGDTEATDMLNISSDNFPALTQSKPAAEVMSGMDEVKYLGTLFDGTVFCIGKKNSTLGIYYYNGSWAAIAVTAAIRTLLSGEKFTSTNFSDKKTVVATGGDMLSITAAGAGYTVTRITKSTVTSNTGETGDEPVPEKVNFVATKSERLLTASENTDVLGASQYLETRWINADDIDFIYVRTELGSYATGFVTYNDYALYFKLNSTHILYGKNRDSYSLDMLSGSVGCVSHKTIAETNSALMWLASDGVYAYSATTLPYKISAPIKKYIDNHSGEAAAVSDGQKYYLSLEQADGSFVLCVYDTQYKQWNIEENRGYKCFLRSEDKIYASDGKNIYELNSEKAHGKWYFVTKPFDLSGTSGKMNLYRLYLNIRAKKGSVLEAFISPDIDSERFINVHRQTFLKDFDDKITINLRPDANLKCMNYFRVRLGGTGECEIYSLELHLRTRRGTY